MKKVVDSFYNSINSNKLEATFLVASFIYAL